MGLHKITAGSGYDYLTRQVAALDSTEKGHTGLASYYSEKGETPGEWIGAGLTGIHGLTAGDVVTAEQMQALFGSGHHPLALEREAALAGPEFTDQQRTEAVRLGAPFKVYSRDASPFVREVAARLAAINTSAARLASAALAVDVRARVRSQVGREFFRAEFGRDPVDERELAGVIARLSRPATTAVAGFDLTFSPVKSVSALWAVADPHTAAAIERAHRAAIRDALAFIEERALFTRTGTNGVRQVDVRGLVATAFTHRDSRAGDPDLHTHVAVANKVQTLDGRWLAIDGRILFKAKVAASETYNTALEHHLTATLGVRFAARDAEPGKRPVREIDGVSPALNARWSTRRTEINARRSQLAAQFQSAHGRPPTPVEALALAQQATLETRDAKHEPRTLTQQRATWRAEATAVLGTPAALDAMIHRALHPAGVAAVPIDNRWIEAAAGRMVAAVEANRSTWQSWHLRAEAQRQVRGVALHVDRVPALVDELVARAVQRSVPLAQPDDGVREPELLQRRDGASVYTVAGTDRYTSTPILAAEQRLVAAAARQDGRAANPTAVELALLESAANGVTLNAGQVALVRGMAGSGTRVQLAIAPAGSGKTTAMRALAAAWTEAGGNVIGLAPSAAAAAQLGSQIERHTDTLAKLTWTLDHPDQDTPAWVASIGPDTLVIIDEAGMADTLSLDTAVGHILSRGGSVRLIGDDQQLGAIGAGGVLRDIATQHGALHLTEIVRFADPAEATASLALREGRPEALGFYLDQRRVHVGDLATLTEQTFAAWRTDHEAGRDAIMLAPTRDLVADLNQRARTHRLAGHQPDRDVTLADGNTASAGDVIISRTNDRRLRPTATDWVKNGDRWTINDLTPSGGIRARHNRTGRSVTLPADYVAASVELGYATTIHGAQGVTADTMHGLATGTETRQQLYTMLTRGRHANHVYLQVVGDGDPHSLIHPDTTHPATATDLLERILARDEAPLSATTEQRHLADPGPRLGQAVARYTDALTVAAEHHTGPDLLAAMTAHAETLVPGISDAPAWPVLRAHLTLISAAGTDPAEALTTAVADANLAGAADPAAVLDWRLDPTGARNTRPGPLPWLPGIPTPLADDPHWGPYLRAREQLVTDLADQVRQGAGDAGSLPAWAATGPRPDPELVADIEVWRAATAVDTTDLRPVGEPQLAKAAALHQRHLLRSLGQTSPALDEWASLLQHLAPALTDDPYTPTLAQQLAHISADGLDARTLLRAAVTEGVLPDDHPAAALWWRINRHLAPAVSTLPRTGQPLASSWTTRLADIVGHERASDLQASPWWPALVTVVDHAIQRGWTLNDLLGTPPAGTSLVDPCQALVWRTSLLLHPLDATDEPRCDEPPHDLWDGYQPEPVAEWIPLDRLPDVRPAGQATGADPVAAELLAADPGPDLTLQAMIRDTLGAPEPTDADIRVQLARADAWRDSGTTPPRLAQINRWANDYYQQQFPGSWAQPYLYERFGVDLAGNPHYQPGYAPAGWTALTHYLRARGVTDHELLVAGLSTRASTGRLIDRFRDRAVLPIVHHGRVLGFVGRRHPQRHDGDNAGPKYVNTPDTPLFHKGAQLYAAEHLLADRATPVLVEGPMDAIAITLATRGRYTGVAPLGTALTDEQAAQLRRWGVQPIVATDADLAGQTAAERDYWILSHHRINPLHAQLPDGSDPADLLARGDRTLLTHALASARPLADTLINLRLDHQSTAEGTLAAIRVLAAQPPAAWEIGAATIAQTQDLPIAIIRQALHDHVDAWNTNPRAATETGIRETRELKDLLGGDKMAGDTSPDAARWETAIRDPNTREPVSSKRSPPPTSFRTRGGGDIHGLRDSCGHPPSRGRRLEGLDDSVQEWGTQFSTVHVRNRIETNRAKLVCAFYRYYLMKQHGIAF